MTIIKNFHRAGIAAALILMLIGGSFAAEAKQTSLNRILEAFEQIDERSKAHEQDAVPGTPAWSGWPGRWPRRAGSWQACSPTATPPRPGSGGSCRPG